MLGGTAQSAKLVFSNSNQIRTFFNINNVGSGTNIFKLQGAVSAGNSIQHGGGYVQMGYLVLGR